MSVTRTALIVMRILNALMKSSNIRPHVLADKFGDFAQKSKFN